MKLIIKSLAASAILSLSFHASAWEWVMDFDTFVNSSGQEKNIAAGRIIDGEYNQSSYVKTINDGIQNVGITTKIKTNNYADNFAGNNNKGYRDLAVAYDTEINAYTTTADGKTQHDPDLKAPFEHYHTGETYNPNNILVIQNEDNYNSCKRGSNGSGSLNGHCTEINDEPGRPAGEVNIKFSGAVSLDSINFFDIDSKNEASNTYVETYAGNSLVEKVFVPGMGDGSASDNKWGTINFSASDAITRIVVYMGGSGGFSDIKLANVVTEVSEPETIGLITLALFLMLYSRKSKNNRQQSLIQAS